MSKLEPTLAQLREMIAAYDVAIVEDEIFAGHEALINARPTDPAALAAWLRWAARPGINMTGAAGGIEHVARYLEALAGQRRAAGSLSSTF